MANLMAAKVIKYLVEEKAEAEHKSTLIFTWYGDAMGMQSVHDEVRGKSTENAAERTLERTRLAPDDATCTAASSLGAAERLSAMYPDQR